MLDEDLFDLRLSNVRQHNEPSASLSQLRPLKIWASIETYLRSAPCLNSRDSWGCI